MRTRRWWGRLAALLLVAALLAACAGEDDAGEDGSGAVVTEDRAVGGFDAIFIDGAGDLSVIQTGTETVSVRTDDNLVNRVRTTVEDGTLRIEMENLVNPTELMVRVEVDDLTRLEVRGVVDGELTTESAELTLVVRDTSALKANGHCTRLEALAHDTATLRAGDLVCEHVTVVATESSEVTVHATASLEARTINAAMIRYGGEPTVSADDSAGGTIEPE